MDLKDRQTLDKEAFLLEKDEKGKKDGKPQ